jgi:hypothetical protein
MVTPGGFGTTSRPSVRMDDGELVAGTRRVAATGLTYAAKPVPRRGSTRTVPGCGPTRRSYWMPKPPRPSCGLSPAARTRCGSSPRRRHRHRTVLRARAAGRRTPLAGCGRSYVFCSGLWQAAGLARRHRLLRDLHRNEHRHGQEPGPDQGGGVAGVPRARGDGGLPPRGRGNPVVPGVRLVQQTSTAT